MTQPNASNTIALHDLPVFAVFSQPKYEPDPESPAIPIRPHSALVSTRASTKQILVSPLKTGSTPDVYLDKTFKPLFVNEPYQDPVSIFSKRQDVLLTNKKPFYPSSPPKKSSSSGDIYGTFGKYPVHSSLPDRTYRPKSAPPPSSIKPPFKPSSPAKKGGPGYYHTTILGFEYPYESEGASTPDPRQTRTHQSFSSSDRYVQTMMGKNPKPFVSRVHQQDLFDRNSPYREVEISPAAKKKQDAKVRTLMASGRNPTHGFYWLQKRSDEDSSSSFFSDQPEYTTSPSATPRSTHNIRHSTTSLSASRQTSAEGFLIHPRPWSAMSHTRGSFSVYPYESDCDKDGDKRRRLTEKAKKPIKPFRPSGTSSYTKPSPSILNRSYHY